MLEVACMRHGGLGREAQHAFVGYRKKPVDARIAGDRPGLRDAGEDAVRRHDQIVGVLLEHPINHFVGDRALDELAQTTAGLEICRDRVDARPGGRLALEAGQEAGAEIHRGQA